MTNNTTDILERMRQVAEWLGSDRLNGLVTAYQLYDYNNSVILFAALARAEMAKKGWQFRPHEFIAENHDAWEVDIPYFDDTDALSEAHAVINAIWEVMEMENS